MKFKLKLTLIFTLAFSVNNLKLAVQPIQNYDIIIIGAGFSGVAAANQIKKSNNSYLILEARDRIGGRIQSADFDGVSIDIGASWVHNYDNHPDHPFRPLIEKYELRRKPFQKITEIQRIYDIEQKNQIEKEIVDKSRNLCEKFYNTAKQNAEKSSEPLSCQEGGKEVLEEIKTMEPIVQRCSSSFISEYENDQASNIRQLSAIDFEYDFQYYDLEEGEEDWLLVGGYKSLFSKVAYGLNFQLKKEVVSIHRSRGKVTIKCSDGSIYQSKRLLVSLPLGVLKANKVKFTPPLPQKHQHAIKYLGEGVLIKVFLSFEENFWGPTEWAVIASMDRGKFTHSTYLQYEGKNILCTFLTDDAALEMKNSTDQEIIDAAVERMSVVFGEKVKFRKGLVTRWQDDPYSLGSYSSFHVGSSKEDCRNLAQPVDGLIWFIGEHVSSEYIGFAHGAWQSGLESGKKVLESL